MQIDAAVGFPGDRAADDVANGQRRVPLALHFAQGGQRVGRFAALRDGEQQRVVVDRRIAIAQLAGVFHFDRNPGQLLDQIFADQRRVPAGAAGGEHDAVDRPRSCCGVRFRPPNSAVASSSFSRPRMALSHRFGLLEDLLEHVVRKAAELDVGRRRSSSIVHACGRCGLDRDAMTRSESAVTTAISCRPDRRSCRCGRPAAKRRWR